MYCDAVILSKIHLSRRDRWCNLDDFCLTFCIAHIIMCVLQALLGYGDGDVFGMSCLSVCGPASDKKVMRQIVTLQRTGQPGAAKVLCYKRDGTPFWSVACTPATCAVLCFIALPPRSCTHTYTHTNTHSYVALLQV